MSARGNAPGPPSPGRRIGVVVAALLAVVAVGVGLFGADIRDAVVSRGDPPGTAVFSPRDDSADTARAEHWVRARLKAAFGSRYPVKVWTEGDDIHAYARNAPTLFMEDVFAVPIVLFRVQSPRGALVASAEDVDSVRVVPAAHDRYAVEVRASRAQAFDDLGRWSRRVSFAPRSSFERPYVVVTLLDGPAPRYARVLRRSSTSPWTSRIGPSSTDGLP